MIRLLGQVLAALLIGAGAAPAQENAAARAARTWRQGHERAILDEYVALLRLPNVSSDRANIQRNADAIAEMLRRRGVETRLLTADGANPIVFGEIRTAGATRTIGFYAHYDGQPLDPREWKSPPFEPTFRNPQGQDVGLPASGAPIDPEWRVYARSAGDDKAPIMAILAALDGLKAAGVALKANVKFAFEGEEEAGSANLFKILSANRSAAQADVWLMCDGPLHQSRRPLVYFGSRDGVRLDLTVYGARNELHSGHYGNWAPNPALSLARLLVSMKGADDRVLVEGFYDGIEPLSDIERRAITDAPLVDRALMEELWLGGVDGAPATLTELVTRPSLNIRGMSSSRVGAQASNVIPSTATASIDIRLVKGMDPAKTQDRVIAHIRKQGYYVVESPPTPEIRKAQANVVWVDRARVGRGAVRTAMDLPISREVLRTVQSVRGPVIALPNMGGNLPLADVEQALGTRTIVVPIANHDNNQHSFDENLRLQNLWDGIEVMAALLAM
jgi:acetylornithine deacetylase/succinyl-diaminopimelate desuccinylase-like protein